MPLRFFENAINNGMCPHPNESYRDLAQAFISQQWDNTTAKYTVEEQEITKNGKLDSFTFHQIEVWLNYVVGQTSSGLKNGDDFVQLGFKCIDHPCVKGRYYRFDNNYWISYFTDEYDSVAKTLAVRRCNNWLKMIDPENGQIFSIPCVVNYEMSSPSTQVSRYVITPNNHATVIVQGNTDTNRLFKLNTRFILGGRPFKLTGYQNAILDNLISDEPTILYLDLFLDEIHHGDDLENQVADNGEYNYTLKINENNMKLPKGFSGQLSVDVALNGTQVVRNIVWTSSSNQTVSITEDGKYIVNGKTGRTSIIRASLDGNPEIFDEITISITDEPMSKAKINISPEFIKIREYESIEFDLSVLFNGTEYYEFEESSVSLSADSIILNNNNLSINKIDNKKYSILCNKFSKDPVNLYISVSNKAPIFDVKMTKQISLVNMLG